MKKQTQEIEKLDPTIMVFTGAHDRNMRLVSKLNEVIKELNTLKKKAR